MDFQLVSDYKPRGDQARAIEELISGIGAGEKHQVLLGVTGSGKTFTMAKIIEELNRPALILAHNKTLAAQLYHEFKQFFPCNAVEYFVSYYDYYQPEAYIPSGDLYIEKEATINEELDKLRLSATRSLFERRDAIIVSFGVVHLRSRSIRMLITACCCCSKKGRRSGAKDITRKLVEILYDRNEADFRRGTFRVRGDVIEVFPTYDENAYRIELFGDEMESLAQIDPLFGTVKQKYCAAADLSEEPLRGAAGEAEDGDGVDSGRAGVVGEGAGVAGAHGGVAADSSAHALRPGDDQVDGLLPRD